MTFDQLPKGLDAENGGGLDPSPARESTSSFSGSRRFALGFLAFVLLTVLVFVLFSRFALQITALYGYDIKSPLVQFSAYAALYSIVTLALGQALTGISAPWRIESRLRAAFLASLALSVAFARYQWQFGAEKSLSNFSFGFLGAFAAALWLTRRRFGLVETVAVPSDEDVLAVEQAHAGLKSEPRPGDGLKRVLDLVVAVGAIIVSAPISLPLAAVLWLQDPGPPLVAKVAVNRGGRSFRQLKLRSMIKDAEAATGPIPAAPDDVRVTRLGRLLRKTHIDELPQMLNIALGDMSLVGPRPERTVFVRRHLAVLPEYPRRHVVRPGLAGLAQVYGDYYSTPREKLRYDLLYIRRRSLRLDLGIFMAALGIALFDVHPTRRHPRRAAARTVGARWARAYRALHGGEPGEAG